MKSRNSGLQGSARTSEKYGDKWSMTESKIDGSCGKTAGTPDASSKDTCVDVEIHRHAEIQYLSRHCETLSAKGMTTKYNAPTTKPHRKKSNRQHTNMYWNFTL